MNKYGLYNRLFSAIDEDEGTFIASAINWVEAVDQVDFKNEEALELFGKAKTCDMLWRKGAINGRISKRRMIQCVRDIIAMNLPNPHDPNEPDPDEIAAQIVEETKIEKTEKPKDQIHVLGVIPEQEKQDVEQKDIEPKGIFGKHKRR